MAMLKSLNAKFCSSVRLLALTRLDLDLEPNTVSE